jgi:hypothetical protein
MSSIIEVAPITCILCEEKIHDTSHTKKKKHGEERESVWKFR